MDNNRLTRSVDGKAKCKSRYSVSGRENIVDSIRALEIKTVSGTRASEDMSEHDRSDLQRDIKRQTGLNAEESVEFTNDTSLGLGLETTRFKEGNRRKSEVNPLAKATLTTFTQPRRKSTSEVTIGIGRHRCSSNSNFRPSPLAFPSQTVSVAWRNDESVCKETSSASTTRKRIICDNERVGETLAFPAMPRVNVSEKFPLSSSEPTHRDKNSKDNRLQSEHHMINAHREHLPEKGHLDSKQDLANRRLPVSEAHGEPTRSRSLSDSDLEDSFMTTAQREKLDRLKSQIYEINSKRKNCRKISGSTCKPDFNGCKQSTGCTSTEASMFPVLTEKSLKRHSKSHEKVIWPHTSDGAIISSEADQTISDASYPNSNVHSVGHMAQTEFDNSVTSMNVKSTELPLTPSTLAYSRENTQKLSKIHFPTPPISDEDDSSESITVIIERLRARSEPGDVGSRKLSTAKQNQSRARLENVALKEKVQSFVEKPLPALPPTTLRVKKSPNGVPAKSGQFKSGTNANIAPEPREKKEGVINIHSCPTLNLFSDRSWMYQDKSKKKHRYIRGPATPVPPVDFVFNKNTEPDGS